jgi:hypothetical protein
MLSALLRKISEALRPISLITIPAFDSTEITDGNGGSASWAFTQKSVVIQNGSTDATLYVGFDTDLTDLTGYHIKVSPGGVVTINKKTNLIAYYVEGGDIDLGAVSKNVSIFGLA